MDHIYDDYITDDGSVSERESDATGTNYASQEGSHYFDEHDNSYNYEASEPRPNMQPNMPTASQVEAAMHTLNQFLRQSNNRGTPTNSAANEVTPEYTPHTGSTLETVMERRNRYRRRGTQEGTPRNVRRRLRTTPEPPVRRAVQERLGVRRDDEQGFDPRNRKIETHSRNGYYSGLKDAYFYK